MRFSATGRLETTFVTEILETERCATCGIIFAIPTAFRKKRKEYGDTFYCPSGHHLSYGESEAAQERKKREEAEARARREKEALERRLNYVKQDLEIETKARKHTEHRLRGQKAATTRIQRRVANGMCPCCSHHFKDLGRHMKNQHPGWDPDKHAEAIVAQAGAQEAACATIGGAADV